MSQFGMRPRLAPASPPPSAGAVQSRNGPPEAVRMIRSTSRGRLAAQRLEDGAVLAVHRDQPGAVRGAGALQQLAGADHALLVGERQHPAVLAPACSPGASPAAPTIADIAQSTGSDAAASSASGPAAAAMPLPASAVSSSASRSASAVTATRAPEPPRLLGEQRDVARRRSAPRPRRPSAPPWSSISDDRVLADRAGRAEDADPPPHRLSCPIAPMPRLSQMREEPHAPHHPVQPVHHPAVPGDQPARVLDPEPPLDRGLEQVAELRGRPRSRG